MFCSETGLNKMEAEKCISSGGKTGDFRKLHIVYRVYNAVCSMQDVLHY